MARTVRQLGHLLLWSSARAKQGWQNVCPHGVVTGSYSSFMHRMHSRSSVARSTVRALQTARQGGRQEEKQHAATFRPWQLRLHIRVSCCVRVCFFMCPGTA